MYIAYDVRNSVEYAKLVKSKRNGKRIEKKYTNLGRDLDKELTYINDSFRVYQVRTSSARLKLERFNETLFLKKQLNFTD